MTEPYKETPLFPVIPKQFSYLLYRSNRIKADLNFLFAYVPQQLHNELSQSIDQYAHYLKNLEVKTIDEGKQFFVHFLVRII